MFGTNCLDSVIFEIFLGYHPRGDAFALE